MKTLATSLILLAIALGLSNAQTFYLDTNGVTIKCENCQLGDAGTVNKILYEAFDRALLEQRRDEGADLTILCTSLVTDMRKIINGEVDFNQDNQCPSICS